MHANYDWLVLFFIVSSSIFSHYLYARVCVCVWLAFTTNKKKYLPNIDFKWIFDSDRNNVAIVTFWSFITVLNWRFARMAYIACACLPAQSVRFYIPFVCFIDFLFNLVNMLNNVLSKEEKKTTRAVTNKIRC